MDQSEVFKNGIGVLRARGGKNTLDLLQDYTQILGILETLPKNEGFVLGGKS